MLNDLILPVPVLMINRRAALPEPLLRHILKNLGYPQELIMSGQTLDGAEKIMIQHLPNLIFYSAFERADLDFIKTIKHCCPSSHLVTFHQAVQAELISAALQAGADAYLLDGASAEAAQQQMKSILRGGAPIDPFIAREILRQIAASEHEDAVIAPQSSEAEPSLLTAREKEILNLVAQGLSNREIAEQLFVSRYTVESHIKHIYRKLSVTKRTKAVSAARSLGIL